MFAAGMAMVLGCGTPITIDAIQHDATAQTQQHADAQSADQLQLARELPSTPPDVVAAFVDLLAEGGLFAAQESCLMFTTTAAAQFATVHHAPSCIAAMQQLHGQVANPAAYANTLSVPDTAWTQIGTTASVNGCAVNWSGPLSDSPSPAPGPLPGLWTLARLDGEGWQITHYLPC
jgi:hypothetical protein